jgi:hypothetical protein
MKVKDTRRMAHGARLMAHGAGRKAKRDGFEKLRLWERLSTRLSSSQASRDLVSVEFQKRISILAKKHNGGFCVCHLSIL